MARSHPETEIVPYLCGDLAAGERARVAEHVSACARCRETAEAFGSILGDLGAATPAPPATDWGRYRADLYRKLAARRALMLDRGQAWRWWRPVPAMLSAALAGVLLLLAFQSRMGEPRGGDLAAVEEAVLGSRLELLRQYSVLEKLDLLEDLDVIRSLDRLADARQGRVPSAGKVAANATGSRTGGVSRS